MNKDERIERARALHRGGCNCCQAVVMAYADMLPIGEAEAHAAAAPFGRGLAGEREVCGCVSGMALVCGLTGHTPLTKQAVEAFRAAEGDIVCARLLQQGKKPCPELVADAAGILHDTLSQPTTTPTP